MRERVIKPEDGEHYQVLTALNEGDIIAIKWIGALSDEAEVKITVIIVIGLLLFCHY